MLAKEKAIKDPSFRKLIETLGWDIDTLDNKEEDSIWDELECLYELKNTIKDNIEEFKKHYKAVEELSTKFDDMRLDCSDILMEEVDNKLTEYVDNYDQIATTDNSFVSTPEEEEQPNDMLPPTSSVVGNTPVDEIEFDGNNIPDSQKIHTNVAIESTFCEEVFIDETKEKEVDNEPALD